MRFDLLQSISLAGESSVPNDDRVGTGDALAWVIDGATDLGDPGLLGSRGGAAWIAMEANAAFAAAGDAPLMAVCKGVFARLSRRFDAVCTRAPASRWELPSAAFLVARVTAEGLELGWLGDCSVLIRRGTLVERIGPPAERGDESARAARHAGHELAQKPRPASIIDSLRTSRERPGRQVLGVEPEGADMVNLAIVPVAVGDELLLMTDGFAALVDGYGAMDEAALMAAVAAEGLAPLATKLRAIEAGDAECVRFPRYKISDDASALWVRVVA
ncbi:MAG: hypothetical protein B7Y43_14990 [Sphingomonas sp. 28-62-20]|uniref:protein phosphatase 2C domain-containing protein n=1 Tax=Sphingomonas sp. 28-62-20 TaxID=1970433 RepID=UPI000AA9903B|nr:MAG: hypothetical protein B7Y43_14990 [Sphingomonas sp. 28-62-20]